ncbi:MAG TPA: biotin/lipoyl-containing protein [Ruminiclostridium sp.]
MKYIVTINNNSYEIEVERGKATIAGTNETAIGVVQQVGGAKLESSVTTQQPVAGTNGAGEPLKAPMPGAILDIRVTEGARVKEGDVLFILEAMKMENEITATKDGIVTQILVTKGALVSTNAVLALIQ